MPEGKNIIRYESPDVFESLTKEWGPPRPVVPAAGQRSNRWSRPSRLEPPKNPSTNAKSPATLPGSWRLWFLRLVGRVADGQLAGGLCGW